MDSSGKPADCWPLRRRHQKENHMQAEAVLVIPRPICELCELATIPFRNQPADSDRARRSYQGIETRNFRRNQKCTALGCIPSQKATNKEQFDDLQIDCTAKLIRRNEEWCSSCARLVAGS